MIGDQPSAIETVTRPEWLDPTAVVACWSGPRNISTAMMRSWGSRSDTYVTDEPLYAHYLSAGHGLDHPGRDEIMARHECDPLRVIAWLTGEIPDGKTIWYQKHMAHHLLPGLPRDWVLGLRNVFLIRDPAAMLASLAKVTPNPALADTGLPQQVELLGLLEQSGHSVPVIDSRAVLRDPRAALAALCDALAVPFDEAMLKWRPGRRETDGVWAPYWYDAVERSTGFEPYRESRAEVPQHLLPVLAQARELYEELASRRC